MRSTAGIAALLVAFMLGLGAGPANAERVFPTLGRPGGGDKQERCERGWYLIGLKVKSGSWTDGVQVICAEILDTNVYRGVKVHDAYFGGNGGGGPTERKCANGERITSSAWCQPYGRQIRAPDGPRVRIVRQQVPYGGGQETVRQIPGRQ